MSKVHRILAVGLTSAAMLAPAADAQNTEYVVVRSVSTDNAVVVRGNGSIYLIETGVGCISLGRYEGRRVIINSPGMFLGIGSSLVIPELDQECRIWNSELITSTGRASPTPSLGLPSQGDDPFSFYDSGGEAVAYLDVDDGLTFFLWSGEPVAYLDGESVYGFNGDHLGWYHDGLVYDGRGRVVAAPASAFAGTVSLPPLRGLKRLKLLKGLKSLRPLRPLFRTTWSETPATAFFMAGRN